MEIREFAERVLLCESLKDKLYFPTEPFTDHSPGIAAKAEYPARPENLRFVGYPKGIQMPHRDSFREPRLRGVAHHIMANHELQALEVMAHTLRLFPDAPADFRKGLLAVMQDEQRHTLMHLRRLEELGMVFGQLRVNGYVWMKAQQFQKPIDYCVCLALTFEGGNLDHALEFSEIFQRAGDNESAEVMREIHFDEISHVAFGLKWLRRLKPAEQSDWEAYVQNLREPMDPKHAMGMVFQRDARLSAGMTDEFVAILERIHREHKTPRKDR